MPSERLILAVDGGQTSTKSLLATANGRVLSAGLGGPSDHFHIVGGVEKNRAAIHGAIRSALAAAGVDSSEITAITLGLTGLPPEGEARNVVYEIIREVVRPEHVTLVADYVTNLTGASGGKSGVVLIAGGGAIGYGVTSEGRTAIAGGYGYLLGDEGSAFKIGVAAIRAATFADDLRGPDTALNKLVCEYFEIDSIRKVTQIVYKAGFSRDRISLLTPIVAQAASEGDAEATKIIADSGHSLGLVGLGIIRQLFSPGDHVEVFRTGGVFNIGKLVIDQLNDTLYEGWPGAISRAPRFQPAVGGLILAVRSLGIEPDAEWFANITATVEQ
jgi:N-acetylglucosamine kinase-like BadF-type ATPase